MQNHPFSKTTLFFLELSVAVLALAVCAAICLSAFASADSISRKSREQSQAALLLQTEAESFRAEAEAALPADSVTYYSAAWAIFDSPQSDGFRLLRRYQASENGVASVELSVIRESQPTNPLFSLTAARYHPTEGGGANGE